MPDQLAFDPPEPPTPDDGEQRSWSDPATPMPVDTNFPLPLRRRSDNHADAAVQALEVLTAAGIKLEEIVDLVTSAVLAPPLYTSDRGEVMRWLDLATDRIIDFEASRRVRGGVLDILDAQFHLEYHARRHAERIAAQAERHTAKAAGTYWRERDARRAATRSIHVEVDPSAWAAMKLDTIRSRTTVGEAVGVLIQSEVERRHQAHGETLERQRPIGQTDVASPAWAVEPTFLPASWSTTRRGRTSRPSQPRLASRLPVPSACLSSAALGEVWCGAGCPESPRGPPLLELGPPHFWPTLLHVRKRTPFMRPSSVPLPAMSTP